MKKIIDINGPDGNAFCLLDLAKNLCNQLDFDSKEIIDKMRSSDYNNLLDVFEENFNDYIILEGRDEFK